MTTGSAGRFAPFLRLRTSGMQRGTGVGFWLCVRKPSPREGGVSYIKKPKARIGEIGVSRKSKNAGKMPVLQEERARNGQVAK